MERWLGLARILIQTASGNKSAELTIEGIKEFELLRDFLYARMRGVKDHHAETSAGAQSSAGRGVGGEELTSVLREAVSELRAIREAMERRGGVSTEGSRHV